MRRKIIVLILVPVGIITIILCMMQLYTNSIMNEIKSAFYCHDFYVADFQYEPEKYPELYADPNVNYVIYKLDPQNPNIFAHYNVTRHSEKTKYLDEVSIDLKLCRVFTWHNFKAGTLWFRYSLTVTDKNGDIITGGWDVPVRMTIKRDDGKWNITSIYEAP